MKVNCPTCKQSLEWNEKAKYRPFCSKRCQLIDLGQWANEENSIAAPHDEQSIDELEDALQKLTPEELEHLFNHNKEN